MAKFQVSDMLAHAFAAEGVEKLFTLMGDANMYWSATMATLPGVQVIHARHEHCAVAMADGYARATGKVGVASTTCGPGFTQIMTGLAAAARANTPMVVFAGDSPIAAAWYLQQIDMAPLALGTGAAYVPVRHIDRLLDNVREAFQIAQVERRPVVLSVPMDLQKQPWPHLRDYTPSSDLVPVAQRPLPDPALVERVADMIAAAERPIIIGGRGAVRSGAREALEALAERCGALLATTLLGKGLFEGNPYALDIAGAFASDFARERFAEADLVIGVGAGLGHYTTESGYLYPGAQVVQIDMNPRGLWQGLRTADLHVRADARAAAEAIVERLDKRGITRQGFRTPGMAEQIAADVPDRKEYTPQPGTVDPRKAILELDRVIPKDWDIVVGGGHYFSIAMTHMRGRPADKYNVFVDFGAIGSGLAGAIGVAVARGDGKVLLIEGDGSLLMHCQELETIRRHGIRMAIAIMNDGGYGAEFHKFRANGVDEKEAIHGRGDLAAVATGFGLRGATVTQPGRFEALFREHQSANTASLWDVHTDDRIVSRAYRRIHYGEA
ncbi:acetolactate synthase [Caldovatus sediminis]|uniref:Acetolactate synthase n=1 Tax=Caldovatus sediminis TaxID=2041189 RepID=A0A8J2Z9Z8_9PROT|nr:thiamine pyrophosphate-binding protein [Caldovatus sediminis]GGG27035.1 acetolactate synthase [Caldovatus sediminis]